MHGLTLIKLITDNSEYSIDDLSLSAKKESECVDLLYGVALG